MVASLKNNFLIAMPSLNDPFFYHSVVYLCKHSEQGSMGIIINMPTKIMLNELLEHLQITCEAPAAKTTPVLFGGPVSKNQGMVLHNHPQGRWTNSIKVSEDIFLTSSADILQDIGHNQGPENMLIALGYASWGEGQLEQEIAENSWLSAPANTEVLFTTPSQQRWQKAASLLGIDIKLLSDDVGHA